MAEGYNRVVLIGNLGQDPELRHTQNGNAVLNMRMATTESFLNQQKERQEKTEWHTVVMWGKRAEALAKILGKGDRIGIEGKLQTRVWEDKEGMKRYSTEVLAQQVILCGSAKKSNKTDKSVDAPPDDAPGDTSFNPAADDFPF